MRTMIRWMFSNHLQGWNPFGRGPTFFWRLKDTILKRRAITNTATFKEGKDITIEYFYPYVVLTLKETFTAKYNGVLPRTPEVWPKSEIYTPKRDEEHPRPFHMGFPPGVETDGELGRVKKWSWRPRSIMHLCAFVEKKRASKKIHNHWVSSLSFSCSVQKKIAWGCVCSLSIEWSFKAWPHLLLGYFEKEVRSFQLRIHPVDPETVTYKC